MGYQVRVVESFGRMTSLFPDGNVDKGCLVCPPKSCVVSESQQDCSVPRWQEDTLAFSLAGQGPTQGTGQHVCSDALQRVGKTSFAASSSCWRTCRLVIAGWGPVHSVWSSPWPCVLMEACPDPMGLSYQRSLRGVEAIGSTHTTTVNGPADPYNRALRFRSTYKTAQILQHIGLSLLRQFPLNKR